MFNKKDKILYTKKETIDMRLPNNFSDTNFTGNILKLAEQLTSGGGCLISLLSMISIFSLVGVGIARGAKTLKQ